MSSNYSYHTIMPRAQAALSAMERQASPQAHTLFKVLIFIFGVAMACAGEFFSFTVGVNSEWEALSDGTGPAPGILLMRYPLIGVLLLTHAVTHPSGNLASRGVWRWFQWLRLLPIGFIIAGIAVFSFVAMSRATGSDEGQTDLAISGLGVACAGSFYASYMICQALMNHLIPAISSLFDGWSLRQKIVKLRGDIAATDAIHAKSGELREIIDAKTSDVLQRTVAAEAAAIVGKVQADVHDIHTMRKALGENIQPHDVLEGLPDIPLPVLEERESYLKDYDLPFWRALLKKEL